MKSVQTSSQEPRTVRRRGAPHLYLVSRAAPRPRWALLYVVLGVVGVGGAVAHDLVIGPLLRHLVDAAFGFGLFVTLVGWIRINRVALERSGEPEAGSGRPHVRVVRSRARAREDGRPSWLT